MLTGRYFTQKCMMTDEPLVQAMRMRIILKACYERGTLGTSDMGAFVA